MTYNTKYVIMISCIRNIYFPKYSEGQTWARFILFKVTGYLISTIYKGILILFCVVGSKEKKILIFFLQQVTLRYIFTFFFF